LRRRERNNTARVLGIDPGSRYCGYGIVSTDGRYVTSGRLELSARRPLHERLMELHEGLTSIIREHGPSNAVVEKVFFAKSVRSALTLGQARGIALLAAASEGLEVHEYSPLEIKKAVTGYGRAEKGQVQEMVKKVLNVRGSLSPDGADALAVAMCHIQRMRFEQSISMR
jgi:crossover junction endodeoxyribonuclease RuvC